jgi:hypothetical protein
MKNDLKGCGPGLHEKEINSLIEAYRAVDGEAGKGEEYKSDTK